MSTPTRLHAPIWEMQPTETPRAFAAFACYRDLGPGRSLARAAAAMPDGPGVGMFKSWSPVYRWGERARAFDAATDRRRLTARARVTEETEASVTADVESYRRRHLDIARKLGDASLVSIAKALQRLEAIDVDEIPVTSLPSFFRAAVAVSEAAASAEAQAIGLGELLGLLEDEAPGAQPDAD